MKKDDLWCLLFFLCGALAGEVITLAIVGVSNG